MTDGRAQAEAFARAYNWVCENGWAAADGHGSQAGELIVSVQLVSDIAELLVSVQDERDTNLRRVVSEVKAGAAMGVTADACCDEILRRLGLEAEAWDEPLELGDPDPIPPRPLSRADVRRVVREVCIGGSIADEAIGGEILRRLGLTDD